MGYGLDHVVLGTGEPLLLIHGTGSSRAAWRPVVPLLENHFRLILLDLPGHGGSALAEGDPTPSGYAPLVAELLDDLGADTAHVAGFSVGAWTALELAKLGRARSVVAFGAAGLWCPRSPRASDASLRFTRSAARAFAPVLPLVLRSRTMRTLFLAQMFGRPWRVPADAALEAARAFASTQGFSEHLHAVNRARFSGGQAIDVPVTIAYGTREALIPKRARLREELPLDARWVELPGCGHVPIWDDPPLVTATILEGAGLAAPAA